MDIRVLASGSAGNCYCVSDGSTSLLLECGISVKQIRRGLGFGLTNVAACLVSHEHQDHAKAVADVLRAGVEVYTSPGTIKALGLETPQAAASQSQGNVQGRHLDRQSLRDAARCPGATGVPSPQSSQQ